MKNLEHFFFMKKALQQARLAFKNREVPVGAVIVNKKGDIISRGYNKIEKNKTQLAHAEAEAIKKACKKNGNWRLDGCWMYVTLEPCLMCVGLMKLSRLKGVVFGARSTLFGVGLDFDKLPLFYRKKFEVVGGIEEKKCLGLLKQFFKFARERG